MAVSFSSDPRDWAWVGVALLVPGSRYSAARGGASEAVPPSSSSAPTRRPLRRARPRRVARWEAEHLSAQEADARPLRKRAVWSSPLVEQRGPGSSEAELAAA